MEEQQNTQPEQPQAQPEQPTKDAVKQADPADVEKNKTMAILAYFIFFLPLVTDAKDSPFAKFHANQSLVLLLGFFILMFINIIPFLGQLLWLVGSIALFVFWIMGLVNASGGKMKELPLIGGIHMLDK
jgi:uncharacterized membrane protein